MHASFPGLMALGALLGAALACPGQGGASGPAGKPEEIGSWLLDCPVGEPSACRLRHKVWLLPPGSLRPSLALEIEARGATPVPVLALRGAALTDATGALLTLAADVRITLDTGQPVPLPCGFARGAILCAPGKPDQATLAANLRRASRIVIRAHFSRPGAGQATEAIPDQTRTLELARTADAISRLPANLGPDGVGWRDLADRLLRPFGFTGGLPELLRWLAALAGALLKS